MSPACAGCAPQTEGIQEDEAPKEDPAVQRCPYLWALERPSLQEQALHVLEWPSLQEEQAVQAVHVLARPSLHERAVQRCA